jgi:hypothetical protein
MRAHSAQAKLEGALLRLSQDAGAPPPPATPFGPKGGCHAGRRRSCTKLQGKAWHGHPQGVRGCLGFAASGLW